MEPRSSAPPVSAASGLLALRQPGAGSGTGPRAGPDVEQSGSFAVFVPGDGDGSRAVVGVESGEDFGVGADVHEADWQHGRLVQGETERPCLCGARGVGRGQVSGIRDPPKLQQHFRVQVGGAMEVDDHDGARFEAAGAAHDMQEGC